MREFQPVGLMRTSSQSKVRLREKQAIFAYERARKRLLNRFGV